MKDKIENIKKIFEELRDQIDSLELSDLREKEWINKIDKLEDNFLKKYKFIKIERNSLICTNINNLERLILSKRAKIDTLD